MYIVFSHNAIYTFNRPWHSINITFTCTRKQKNLCDSRYGNICFIVVVSELAIPPRYVCTHNCGKGVSEHTCVEPISKYVRSFLKWVDKFTSSKECMRSSCSTSSSTLSAVSLFSHTRSQRRDTSVSHRGFNSHFLEE